MFKNKEISKKFIIAILSIVILSGVIFSIIVFIDNDSIRKYDILEGGEAKNIKYSIDDISYGDDRVNFQGWVFKQGEDLKTINISLILRDETNGEYIKINTNMMKRNDIQNAYGGANKIENCGFFASIRNIKLNKDTKYTILIQYKNNYENILINTKKIFKI